MPARCIKVPAGASKGPARDAAREVRWQRYDTSKSPFLDLLNPLKPWYACLLHNWNICFTPSSQASDEELSSHWLTQGGCQGGSIRTSACSSSASDDLRHPGPDRHELRCGTGLVRTGTADFARDMCPQTRSHPLCCRPIEKPFPRWRRSIVEASRCP